MENIQVELLEEFLNKLTGVLNSRIVLDKNDQIIEVHILANNARSPKQMLRDIQSAIMAKFNIRIDHKVISIAQVFEKDESYNNTRLVIKGVEYASYNMSGKAKVILEHAGIDYIGESDGIHSSTQANRIVGQAAISAVEQFFANKIRFNVEEIKIVDLSNRRIVITGIYMFNRNIEKLLVGKCIVENDINSAVTKAVLDAVNRLFELN